MQRKAHRHTGLSHFRRTLPQNIPAGGKNNNIYVPLGKVFVCSSFVCILWMNNILKVLRGLCRYRFQPSTVRSPVHQEYEGGQKSNSKFSQITRTTESHSPRQKRKRKPCFYRHMFSVRAHISPNKLGLISE